MACLFNLQRCNAGHEAERNGVSTEHAWRYSGISHRYPLCLYPADFPTEYNLCSPSPYFTAVLFFLNSAFQQFIF